MKRILTTVFYVVVLTCASGDAYRWPPYKDQLVEMFWKNIEPMLTIEQQMISDGRTVAQSSWMDGHPRQRAGEPEITAEQLEKYSELFHGLGLYGTFTRSENTTQVRLNSQNVWSRDYYISYVHTAEQIDLETCKVVNRSQPCGECYEPLEADWILYYRWYPELGSDDFDKCVNGR